MVALKKITTWIEGVQGNCRLAAMEEAQSVFFASQLLRGAAKLWWSSWAKASTCVTWKEFREGLTLYFVGPQPYELLCKELGAKRMLDFSRYEGFKAWFTSTVANMRLYAPNPDRMWAENVLVDCLLQAITGTLYYETVVLDPATSCRPSTLLDAIRLLDARHHVLLIRKMDHGSKDGAGPSHGGGNGGGHGGGGHGGGGNTTNDKDKRKRKEHGDAGGSRGGGGGHGGGGNGGGKGLGLSSKKSKGNVPSTTPRIPRDEYNAKKFGITAEEAKTRWEAKACLKCGMGNHRADACRKEN